MPIMSVDLAGVQHTRGHINCPRCEKRHATILRGGDINPQQTFSEAAKLWLAARDLGGNFDRARYVKARTLASDGEYVRALGKFFDEMPLGKIHPGNMRCYQEERAVQPGRKPGTQINPLKVNQELSTLIRIMRQAGAWTAEHEAGYVPLIIGHGDVQRALSPEDQQRFLGTAASRTEWQIVYWYSIVALHTSCNSIEMRQLHVSDISLFERVLMVREESAKNQRRVRTIPLSRDALWAAGRLIDRARALGAVSPEHYIFPFYVTREVWDPCRPMTVSGLKKRFDEVRKAAGLPWLRIHDLRHSAITRMAEAGVPIATIMSMAGHISPRMSRHYTQVSQAAKQKAIVETFDGRPAPVRLQKVAKG